MEMWDAFEKGNIQELATKVHALKGVGGFAGFPIYTEKAKELKNIIVASRTSPSDSAESKHCFKSGTGIAIYVSAFFRSGHGVVISICP